MSMEEQRVVPGLVAVAHWTTFSIPVAYFLFLVWSESFWWAAFCYLFFVSLLCLSAFSRFKANSGDADLTFRSWLALPLTPSKPFRDICLLVLVCALALPGLAVVGQTGLLGCKLERPGELRWVTDWSKVPVAQDEVNAGFVQAWKEVSEKRNGKGFEDADDDKTCVVSSGDDSAGKEFMLSSSDSDGGFDTILFLQRRSDGSTLLARSENPNYGSCINNDKRDWFGAKKLAMAKDSITCFGQDGEDGTMIMGQTVPLTIVPDTVCSDASVLDGLIWFRTYREGVTGFEVVSLDPSTMAMTSYSLLREASASVCVDPKAEKFWAKVGMCVSALPIVLAAPAIGVLYRVPSMSAALFLGLLLGTYFFQLGHRDASRFYPASFTFHWIYLLLAALLSRFDRPDKLIWSWAFELPSSIFALMWTAMWLPLMKTEVDGAGDVVLLYLVIMIIFTPCILMTGTLIESKPLTVVGLAATAVSTLYASYAIVRSDGVAWLPVLFLILGLAMGAMTLSHRKRESWRRVGHVGIHGIAMSVSRVVQAITEFTEPEKPETSETLLPDNDGAPIVDLEDDDITHDENDEDSVAKAC